MVVDQEPIQDQEVHFKFDPELIDPPQVNGDVNGDGNFVCEHFRATVIKRTSLRSGQCLLGVLCARKACHTPPPKDEICYTFIQTI